MHEEEEGEEGDQVEQRYEAVRIGDDLRLSSGKILTHRSHARSARHREYQQRVQARLPPTAPSHSHSPPGSSSGSPPLSSETINLILSHRPPSSPSPEAPQTLNTPSQNLILRKGTESSLLGVSANQQKALLATVKKMEEGAGRARNEFFAGVERRGNCQKTFRVKSIGKKAGGLEKRLG